MLLEDLELFFRKSNNRVILYLTKKGIINLSITMSWKHKETFHICHTKQQENIVRRFRITKVHAWNDKTTKKQFHTKYLSVFFSPEIRCPHKIDSKNKTSIKHIYFLPVAIVCLLYQPYIYISKPDKILTRFHNAIIHHALSLNQTNDR